jgi:hypothetical protein
VRPPRWSCATHTGPSGSPEPERLPPRSAPTRQLVRLCIAVLVLLACVAQLAPHSAVAQDRGRSPSGLELSDRYPLDASPQPAAEGAADSSPAAPAPDPPARAPADPSSRTMLQLAVFAMLAIFAFAVGLAISARAPRGRRERGPRDTVTPLASKPAAPRLLSPAHGSGQERLPEPAALPPVTRQAWTAEVQWQQTGAGSCFCVIARSAPGAGTAVVAKSEPVEWPPASAATVQRVTAAARELETSLVAAGWRPLPPGDAWYAKRFAWQPVASTPDAQPGRSIEDRAAPPAPGRFDRGRARPERPWPAHVKPVPAQGDDTTP